MKLAFYYHIPLVKKQDRLYIPGYLGVFIDALANTVTDLYLVLHEARTLEENEADYELKAQNIIFISLGTKTPAWHRLLHHKKILKTSLSQIEDCDYFIVRSPSPLAPYFYKYLKKPVVVFMVVGDYAESVTQTKFNTLRELVILVYLVHNDYLFRRRMKYTDVLVNSPALFQKYKKISKSIHQIKTTTLSKNDFFYRDDTCQSDKINLLFTGRIDPLKGLFDLVRVVSKLIVKKYNVILNIAGWEPGTNKPVEHKLRQLSIELNVEKRIIFHGRKATGDDLNQMYRMADIYVLPSHEEGFPRTIWEAMANSLPVVTTRVGGIPLYLDNNEDALIVVPKNVDRIADAIDLLITNKNLRKKLILNGRYKAENNTLEIQTKQLVDICKNLTEPIKNQSIQ